MTVVRLEEEDLDEEDRAALAEVARKGYYHGRPKNETCASWAPQQLSASSAPVPTRLAQSQAAPVVASRTQFDDFQRKWDRFDKDGGDDDTSDRGSTPRLAPVGAFSPEDGLEFSIVLMGGAGVGTTTFLRRHLTGEYSGLPRQTPAPTRESHLLKFGTNVGEIRFRTHRTQRSELWQPTMGELEEDAGGHLDGVIVMFDVTAPATFDLARRWVEAIKKACGPLPIVLVGNKVDSSKRQVTARQILDFRNKHTLPYYEVSMLRSLNVEKPFLCLSRLLAGQASLKFVGPVASRPPPFSCNPACFAHHQERLRAAQATPLPS